MKPIRQAVVAEAMTWLGTMYHHDARIKGGGVDCLQILIAVYSAVGLIEAVDAGYYPPDWMMHRSEERYLAGVLDRAVEVDAPLPGDVALYKVGRCFAHAVIVIDWPLVIHASNRDRAVVLADGTQGWLSGREVKFFRANGVEP